MRDRGALLTGFGMGIGLMYFLDPDRGRRRRALVRDKVTHASRVSRSAVGATSRDVANRATGVAARMRRALRRDGVEDEKLVARVRASIGHVVAHPRAVEVEAYDGVVTLRGPILESEVNPLLTAVEQTPGVREVIADLDEYSTPADVPALQGDWSRTDRRSIWRRQTSPTARFFAGTAGLALAGYGVTRRDSSGWLLAAAGAGICVGAARRTGSGRTFDASAMDWNGSGRNRELTQRE